MLLHWISATPLQLLISDMFILLIIPKIVSYPIYLFYLYILVPYPLIMGNYHRINQFPKNPQKNEKGLHKITYIGISLRNIISTLQKTCIHILTPQVHLNYDSELDFFDEITSNGFVRGTHTAPCKGKAFSFLLYLIYK